MNNKNKHKDVKFNNNIVVSEVRDNVPLPSRKGGSRSSKYGLHLLQKNGQSIVIEGVERRLLGPSVCNFNHVHRAEGFRLAIRQEEDGRIGVYRVKR